MLKKNLKKILMTLFFLFILGSLSSYFILISQVKKLKDHYPVFNKKTKSYQLTKKRPSFWVPISKISKEARYAIMISEDWAFCDRARKLGYRIWCDRSIELIQSGYHTFSGNTQALY